MVPRFDDRHFSKRPVISALPSSSGHPQPVGQAGAALSPVRHDLVVLCATEALLVVDKPPGLLVHRSGLDAHETDTVLDRLRPAWGPLSPVHRLDKGTSGVLVLARQADAARALGQAFETGQCRKRYLALVRGWPADEWSVDHPLARDPERPSLGQPMLDACTRGRTLARAEWPLSTRPGFDGTRVALVEAWPETGRRHQIRRHLKHLGHPLIGDSTHGKGPLNRALADWLGVQRLWLHALSLAVPALDDWPAQQWLAAAGPEWKSLPDLGAAVPPQ
ncbi:pseudouridine synthase [Ideonella sp. 4Y16]|nr:pseudouridine synthase [Ideonella alba]